MTERNIFERGADKTDGRNTSSEKIECFILDILLKKNNAEKAVFSGQ